MAVIPFYGATNQEMFAIERAAMDRPRRVTEHLAGRLPQGNVIDIGAGDGFTAHHLTTTARRIVAVEPASGMIRRDRPLDWVRADAARLPFRDGSCAAGYSTWAYFFTRNRDPSPGIAELHRVVEPGGPLIVVDNAGEDEFCALTATDISADAGFWQSLGWTRTIVETEFAFETIEQAQSLLGFFFGDRGRAEARLRIEYRVAVFESPSRGPAEAKP